MTKIFVLEAYSEEARAVVSQHFLGNQKLKTAIDMFWWLRDFTNSYYISFICEWS